ncbi:DUF2490 domain-containing protein [Lacibacter sp. H407]|uniref:DUF2490 domain-containing protein n=1 Tax=Lacibacter sp. H407 TaxID=3133423 RepID=UPI0030C2FF1D
MKYVFLTSSLVLLLLSSTNAQTKTTVDVRQLWTGYFNQTRLTDKWGFWTDVHLRTKDNYFNNLSQGIIRLGLTYYLSDDAKLTAGYAYVNHFPSDNHKNISQPEHRPWQQIQWHTKYPRLKLMQWFRLEERYRRKIKNDDELADGYNFNFRLRYNILSQFPLSKKRFQPNTFSFVLSNEVFVNFGKQIVYNVYDQNRFFAGFHYHVNKHDNLQFGYMNIYQQLAAGNQYRSTHAARVFYFHNLDLRKKAKHE